MSCLNSNEHYFIIKNGNKPDNSLRFYVFNNEENILLLKEYNGSCISGQYRYTYKFKLSYLNRKPNLELIELYDSELRRLKFEVCNTSNSKLIIKFWKYGVYNVNISKQDILNQMLIYDASYNTDTSVMNTSNNIEVKLEKGSMLSFCKASFEYPYHQKVDDNHHKCSIALYLDIDIRPNLTYEIMCKSACAVYRNICNSVFETKNVEFEEQSTSSDNISIDLVLEDV